MAQKQRTYAVCMAELQLLLASMQSETLDIDESLRQYERGQLLIAELEALLQVAENTVRQRRLASAAQEEG